MNEEFQDYINRIVEKIGVNGKKEKQIREDLYESLMEKQEITGESSPNSLLGKPEEIAKEFRENLNIKPHTRNYGIYIYGFEYTSKVKIFGIPLVHVNGNPLGVAKGIFSFGSIAIGVFSFGGVAIGAISLGGFALGIIAALGGGAISGGISIGGLAISYGISIGGLAIANFLAYGGYARANIAIGGVTNGIVSIFNQHGTGKYIFKTPVDVDKVTIAIRKVYPNIGNSLLNFINDFLNLQ